MSGSNQFLPFATGAGSNTLTPSAYAALTPLLNLGFQSGVAQSIQFNTVFRQASFVAAAVAQLIADATDGNVLDNGVVITFEEQLAAAIDLCLYGVDGGAANAYSVTYAVPITAITDGIRLRFRALHANTGASTFNPSGLGSQPIYSFTHSALIGGEIVVGGDIEVVWNSVLAGWVLLECTGGAQQLPNGTYGVTPTTSDNTTKIATTAFVTAAITTALATAAATQIGIGQTWQNVTGSRANGTTYTNSTSKPILVSITTGTNATTNHTITVAGVVAQQAATNPNATTAWVSAIVPPGATYVASSNGTLAYWAELR